MLSGTPGLRTKAERHCRQSHVAAATFTRLALALARSWCIAQSAMPCGFARSFPASWGVGQIVHNEGKPAPGSVIHHGAWLEAMPDCLGA